MYLTSSTRVPHPRWRNLSSPHCLIIAEALARLAFQFLKTTARGPRCTLLAAPVSTVSNDGRIHEYPLLPAQLPSGIISNTSSESTAGARGTDILGHDPHAEHVRAFSRMPTGTIELLSRRFALGTALHLHSWPDLPRFLDYVLSDKRMTVQSNPLFLCFYCR